MLTALCCASAATDTGLAQPALKYRLHQGDQLVYERRTEVRALSDDAVLRRLVQRVQLWCLADSATESVLLLDIAPSTDGNQQPAQAALLHMSTSGRRRWPRDTARRFGSLDPALELLPMLPLAVQSADDWVTPPDFCGRQWRCTSHGPDPANRGHVRVEFQLDDRTGTSTALGITSTGQLWFDTTAGRVSRYEAQTAERWSQTRAHVVAVVRQTLTHTPQWAARRAAEADAFLRAWRHEDRLLDAIIARPGGLGRSLAQLDRAWAGFSSDVETEPPSPFLRLARGRLRQIHSDVERLRAWADLGRRWLNKAARPWSLQAPSGETVTSETTRRGVTIECFWSAAEPWGLRVLRPVAHLASAPGRYPVTIVCYNMDFDYELARRAIEQCGQGLTHLLGSPLQDIEAIPEFPVIRVLDQRGIVRGLWIGWRPSYEEARDLAQQLAKPH